jgi:hypothetical protein
MRKQYNFRPSANSLDARDVDNLIAASSGLPVREVALDSIADIDTDFWFKFGPTPTVRRIIDQIRLIQEVDLSYPIILGSDGRVMDGMHRIARRSSTVTRQSRRCDSSPSLGLTIGIARPKICRTDGDPAPGVWGYLDSSGNGALST